MFLQLWSCQCFLQFWSRQRFFCNCDVGTVFTWLHLVQCHQLGSTLLKWNLNYQIWSGVFSQYLKTKFSTFIPKHFFWCIVGVNFASIEYTWLVAHFFKIYFQFSVSLSIYLAGDTFVALPSDYPTQREWVRWLKFLAPINFVLRPIKTNAFNPSGTTLHTKWMIFMNSQKHWDFSFGLCFFNGDKLNWY